MNRAATSLGQIDPAPVDFELMLLQAATEARSGCLALQSGCQVAGSVILSRGRVAWATCADQPENLGCFLEKLGHVTPDQLREVTAEFARRGSTTKLGHLLEETGVISRSVLRRCLLLHVRMALACLLHDPEMLATWTPGAFCAEDELLFHLYQVLPDWYQVPAQLTAAATWRAHRVGTDGLGALGDLPGYRGSVVADWTGRHVAMHGFLDDGVQGATRLAGAAVALFEAPQGWTNGALGESTQAILEGTKGAVAARWLDSSCQLLVAVSLGESGKAGVTLHRLTSAAPVILFRMSGEEGDS